MEFDVPTFVIIFCGFGALVAVVSALITWFLCARGRCKHCRPSSTPRIFDGLRRGGGGGTGKASNGNGGTTTPSKVSSSGSNGQVKYSGKALEIANRYGITGANGQAPHQQQNNQQKQHRFSSSEKIIDKRRTSSPKGSGGRSSPSSPGSSKGATTVTVTVPTPPPRHTAPNPSSPPPSNIPRIVVTRASIKSNNAVNQQQRFQREDWIDYDQPHY